MRFPGPGYSESQLFLGSGLITLPPERLREASETIAPEITWESV